MSTIKINTVSSGPSFITLNPGSTYEISNSSDYSKTIITEKNNQGAAVSNITITKYQAADANINWEKCNEGAYKLIEQIPSQFGYPTYDGFNDLNYLELDLASGFENIINNALSNDLPAEYSEWLSWTVGGDADNEAFQAVRAEAESKGTEAAQNCEDALADCGTAGQGGYFFDEATGLDCDCNSLPSASGCCIALGASVTSSIIEAGAPVIDKKHIIIFDSVSIAGAPG